MWRHLMVGYGTRYGSPLLPPLEPLLRHWRQPSMAAHTGSEVPQASSL